LSWIRSIMMHFVMPCGQLAYCRRMLESITQALKVFY